MTHPARDDFRAVAGRFATGVTVVTSLDEVGDPHGLTANSFTSVSLDPPLVLVCVDRSSHSHDRILGSGFFAVNVLAAEDDGLAERFWRWDRDRRFEGLAWRTEETGAPVLDAALAWLDCRVVDRHGAGDHTIIIGRVEGCDQREGEPLLFWGGAFHRGAGRATE